MDILSKYAFFNSNYKMYRVYTTVLQTAVPTGRLAMTNPNLQAITHSVTFVSLSFEKSIKISIRDSFISRPDFVLLSADYAQLELRLMAHFSKDQKLLSILKGSGDFFKEIASKWLDKPISSITTEDRSYAKHICYGILYGMGANALAAELKISPTQAMEFIDSFKSRYPGITKFLCVVVEKCKKNGYVSTIYGRKRYLPEINSTNNFEYKRAERQAVNTICQGSAADLVKVAMNKIFEKFKEVNTRTLMVLQLHDELLFEVPKEEVDVIQHLVKQVMENVLTLDLSLPVRLSVGTCWGSLVELPKS